MAPAMIETLPSDLLDTVKNGDTLWPKLQRATDTAAAEVLPSAGSGEPAPGTPVFVPPKNLLGGFTACELGARPGYTPAGLAATPPREGSDSMTDSVLRSREETGTPKESKKSKIVVVGGGTETLGISSDEEAAADGSNSGDH